MSAKPKLNLKLIKLDHSGVDVVFASLITFTLIYLSVSILTMAEVYQSNWILSSIGIISTIHLLVTPIGYFGMNLDQKVMILFFVIGSSVWALLIALNIIFFISGCLFNTFTQLVDIILIVISFQFEARRPISWRRIRFICRLSSSMSSSL